MHWSIDPILPSGKVDFTVEFAKEELSKKGNPFLAMRLRVENAEGECATVFHNEFPRNINAFLEAIGHDVEGKTSGDFEPGELVGESGRCMISIEEYEGRTRNRVSQWLPPLPAILKHREDDKEDIPF
jgi:hypothetical protein